MSKHKTIQDYLETVAAQIRWKRARPVVTLELARHLEDQRDTFAAEGCENAEQLAVEEMGDPVSVGMELDCIHRPKPQWGLLALTILLALAGAILRIWLTASWEPYYMDIDPLKTMLAFVLGCGALLAGYFLDYARLGRHAGKIYIGALVAGVIVLVFSPIVNGVSYYTRYVTLCYPVVYAFWLYTCRKKGWAGLILAVIGAVPLALICLVIPYKLGVLLLLLTGFILLLVAAWNDWFGIGRWKSVFPVILCALMMGGAVFCGVFSSDYNTRRFEMVFHPEQDPYGVGYLALSIRKAIGASQWLGEGSWSADYPPFELTVPGCDSDAFLTTLIYKLGWLPFMGVVLVFVVLMVWLLHRCLQHKSQLGKVVVLAVLIPLCVQALCSIAWNLSYTLLSSAFPLIIGNLNTVLDMGLIGLALSVFRGESIAQDPACHEMLLPRYRIKLIVQKV